MLGRMYNSVIENNILRDGDLSLVAQLGVTCGKQPSLLPSWAVGRTWRKLRVRLLRGRLKTPGAAPCVQKKA